MLSKTTTETQELQAIAVSDIVEKEERRSMRKARSEVHAITRENFDVIRSDLSSTAWVLDLVNLPAQFAVWLASDEAELLKGRFLWANWDVSELQQRKKEILDRDLLRLTVAGL